MKTQLKTLGVIVFLMLAGCTRQSNMTSGTTMVKMAIMYMQGFGRMRPSRFFAQDVEVLNQVQDDRGSCEGSGAMMD
jgi:hypothetical protein